VVGSLRFCSAYCEGLHELRRREIKARKTSVAFLYRMAGNKVTPVHADLSTIQPQGTTRSSDGGRVFPPPNIEYLANREAIVSVYTKGYRCNSIAYNSIT